MKKIIAGLVIGLALVASQAVSAEPVSFASVHPGGALASWSRFDGHIAGFVGYGSTPEAALADATAQATAAGYDTDAAAVRAEAADTLAGMRTATRLGEQTRVTLFVGK